MRPLLVLATALSLGLPALATAQTKGAAKPVSPAHPRPSQVGKFEDWTAATSTEGGQTVCYALTRATASTPALPGRGEVVLTVTQRRPGRDAVAITAGFAYPASAEVAVQVEQTALDFYTSGRNAFARDNHAAVEAFKAGAKAVAKSPGPRGAAVTDTFSLRGFGAAYAALGRTCPAK